MEGWALYTYMFLCGINIEATWKVAHEAMET